MPFGIHPHMLGHTTGFKLANQGVDTRSPQHYLGHTTGLTIRYSRAPGFSQALLSGASGTVHSKARAANTAAGQSSTNGSVALTRAASIRRSRRTRRPADRNCGPTRLDLYGRLKSSWVMATDVRRGRARMHGVPGIAPFGLTKFTPTLAQAVSGSVGSQSTATNVPALYVGIDRPWRSQECSADGGAGLRSATMINCTTSSQPGCGMPGRRRQNFWFRRISLSAARCRAGDRRHRNTQERHAFGRCRCAGCFGAGQDRELPDPGVADAGAW
jgi:hypothetical protein